MKETMHDTEDKNWWMIWGEDLEKQFVENICPAIGLTGVMLNPDKQHDPTAPDLVVNGKLADLKTQNTPFFTSGQYIKNTGGIYVSFDPSFTVTFNQKDYLRYKELYPEIDIYFWVQWKQVEGYGVVVLPISGVWRVSFEKLMINIQNDMYPLHTYSKRTEDQLNANHSYVMDLRDFMCIVSM